MPLAFLVAGAVAVFTGFSYAVLANAFPRAAGEAIFVKNGIGEMAGRITGYGVIAVAITSSAVIALAFARFAESFSGLPEPLSLVVILVLLSGVAMAGVRESVAFAAIIGFEDIENMAEETHDAARTIPLAIILTLAISVAVYVAVAVVAAAYPDRAQLVASKAPLSDLFAAVTGWPGTPIAVMASIAMVNGILVQIVMASRVIYGMSREAMPPETIGRLHAARQTPVRAIALLGLAIAAMGLLVPLLQLAELTSFVMLSIFTAVNLSLFLIGRRADAAAKLRRWRWWGLGGAVVSLGLAVSELIA